MGASHLHRGPAVVAVVVGAAGLLGGCTGEGGALPSMSPTADAAETSPAASPSVAASPSPTVIETPLSETDVLAHLPKEGLTEDFPSAIRFTQYFTELYAPMFAPPYDTSLFASLSGPGCVFCNSAVSDAIETRDAGAVSAGGEFHWPDTEVGGSMGTGGLADDGSWYVEQRYEVAATVTTLADGTETVSRGGQGSLAAKLQWTGQRWEVLGMNFLFDDE